MPLIGFLDSKSPEGSGHLVAEFRRGLNGSAFIEGQNVAIEFRWAQNNYDQLPALAADLVRRRVDVIAATGGPVCGKGSECDDYNRLPGSSRSNRGWACCQP